MRAMSTTSRQPETEVAPVSEIRQHFPALERVHNGYPVAYFDGPGGTQVPRYVVEKMTDYLYHHNANTHWAYPTSAETDAAIEHAREACAERRLGIVGATVELEGLPIVSGRESCTRRGQVGRASSGA